MASHPFASHILFLNKFGFKEELVLTFDIYLVFDNVDIFIKISRFFEQLATLVFWLPCAGGRRNVKNVGGDKHKSTLAMCRAAGMSKMLCRHFWQKTAKSAGVN